MQSHNRLARAGGTAHTRRPIERPLDVLGLLGVQERHPVLDRLRHGRLEVSLLQVGVVDQSELIVRGGLKSHLLPRARNLPWPGAHGWEQGQTPGQDGVDLHLTQPVTSSCHEAEDVVLADNMDAVQILVDIPHPGEHEDGNDLRGCEAGLGKVGAGVLDQVTYVGDLVGDIGLAAEDSIPRDGHVGPALGVDHVDAARPDQHEVDVGARPRPTPVCQVHVAERRQPRQHLRRAKLGLVCHSHPACQGALGCRLLLQGAGALKREFGTLPR